MNSEQNSFQDRFASVRKKLELTVEHMANKCHVTASYISAISKGRKVPSELFITLFSNTFGVRKHWLLTGEGEMWSVKVDPPETAPTMSDPRPRGPSGNGEGKTGVEVDSAPSLPPMAIPTRAIPVLGRVPAGFPSHCPEEILEYISLPNVPEGAYALIVHGESMAPTIRSGDYVIFVPGSDQVKSGDVVIVNNEWGESMCKRYREKGGERILASDNAEYPSVKPNGNYRILGRVIKVWRDIEF